MSGAPHGAESDLSRFRERLRTREGRADMLLFSVGGERFALELTSVDEALDLTGVEVHDLPGRGASLRGVISLRGTLVPLYVASLAMGIGTDAGETALVFRTPRGRIAIAVADAEDVLSLDLSTVRSAPHASDASMLLGVVQLGNELIGIVDDEALLAVCRADPSLETS